MLALKNKVNNEIKILRDRLRISILFLVNFSFTRLGVVIAKNLNLSGSMWINPWLEKYPSESVALTVQDSLVLQQNLQLKDFQPFYCKKYF